MTCSILVLNLVFNNLTESVPGFNTNQALKYQNQVGVLMNISGFVLVYLMRSAQQANSSMSTVMRKAQNEWLQLMTRKLIMSLTLTPITDRLITFLFMGSMSHKAMMAKRQQEAQMQ